MKKVLAFIAMFMFLLSSVVFAKNAAELKVAIDYWGSQSSIQLDNSSSGADLFVYLVDEDGAPATAGPNGEALSSLSVTVSSFLFGSGITVNEYFDGFASAGDFGNGATARLSVNYGSVASSSNAFASTTSDTLTVTVSSLSVKGTVKIAPPDATGLVLIVPGGQTFTEPSKVYSSLSSIEAYDNETDISYRLPGSDVKYYVYAVQSNGLFTTAPNLEGKTITIKSSGNQAGTESWSCTMTNGACSGTIDPKQVYDNEKQTITAQYSTSTSLIDTSATATYYVTGTKLVLLDNASEKTQLSTSKLFTDNSSDNSSSSYWAVAWVDANGNFDNASNTTSTTDEVADNTTSGACGLNMKVVFGSTTISGVSGTDNKSLADGVAEFSYNLQGQDNDNNTYAITFYDNCSSGMIDNLTISSVTHDNSTTRPVLAFDSSASVTVGTSVDLIFQQNSDKPSGVYNDYQGEYYVYFSNGTTTSDNITVTPTKSTDRWTVSVTNTKAISNAYAYLCFKDWYKNDGTNRCFTSSNTRTFTADVTTPTVSIPNVAITSATDSGNKTDYDVTVSDANIDNSTTPITVSQTFYADSKVGNFFLDTSSVTVKDQYGNNLSSSCPVSTPTSEIGHVYLSSGTDYYVQYDSDDVGKEDTISVTACGASTSIKVTTIKATASKLQIEVVAPTWDDTFSGGNYYAGSELVLKVSSDSYIASSSSQVTYDLVVDTDISGLELQAMSDDYNSDLVNNKIVSQTLTAGSSTSHKYYILYAPSGGSVTINAEDQASTSPLDNGTITLTFANQDKTAPTITAPTVVAGGVTFTASDNVEVASVTVSVSDEDGNSVDATVTTTEGDNGTDVSVSGLETGTYTFDITVKDAEGNTTNKSYIRTITEAAPTCDSSHLDLCTDNESCVGAGGTWDDNASSCSSTTTEGTNAAPSVAREPVKYDSTNPTSPTPGSVEVDAASSVLIQPTLNVPSEIQGKAAKAKLYIYLPTSYTWIPFSDEDVASLGSSYTFKNIPNALDFTSVESEMSFQVWYGLYVDGVLYYDYYTVTVK